IPTDLHETQTIEVDGTVLAGGLAVPTDAAAAVPRQRLLEKRHLFGSRFLHAQDVGLDLVEGRSESALAHGPVELLPRRAFAPPALVIPGDSPDGGRTRLRRRGGPAWADRQPDDQPEPTGQDADKHPPRRPEEISKRPKAPASRCGVALALAAKAHDEPRQDGGNRGKRPPHVTEGGKE